MELIHNFLCPSTPFSKVIERSETIMKQMQRETEQPPISDNKVLTYDCELCGNTNEDNCIIDHTQGITICMGLDGRGCGNVITERMMRNPNPTSHQDTYEYDSYDLFSKQEQFSSQLKNATNHINRINSLVEKNLNRFGREDTVTSDHYKDKQRQVAYSLLDRMQDCLIVHSGVIKEVKILFHEYRTRMYRIHKLEVALAALFFIVLSK